MNVADAEWFFIEGEKVRQLNGELQVDIWARSRAYFSKGLFTWRKEDPSTRKILESETNFRLVYMQKFRSGLLLEIK